MAINRYLFDQIKVDLKEKMIFLGGDGFARPLLKSSSFFQQSQIFIKQLGSSCSIIGTKNCVYVILR